MFNNKTFGRKLYLSYLACSVVSGSTAFFINNWTLLMYRDYYYNFTNMTAMNMCSIAFAHLPMIPKSLMIGTAWPVIVSDFYFYGDKKAKYKAFRHITPWTNDNIIVRENNRVEYIDLEESLDKYGVIGFYFYGKCVEKKKFLVFDYLNGKTNS